jgi:hypothetical protein
MSAASSLPWREPTEADMPVAGPTGSRVKRGDITIHNRDRRHRYERKLPPTRGVPIYDDEGDEIGIRERTDEEMATITAAYEKHVAEHKRTHGILVEKRAPDFTLEVDCEDGSRAIADWCGDEWRWSSVWTISFTPPPIEPATAPRGATK